MPRLLPLFCLCVVLPLILLGIKIAVSSKHKTAPAERPTALRKPSEAYAAQLKTKATVAKRFVTQKGLSSRIAFLLDMRLPSGRKRFFIYDLKGDSVLAAGLVAHGSCRQRFLETARFSNAVGCGCSAAGRYKVGGAYGGRFGKAFKLHGLDSTNANAFERNIVLHAYRCVPDEEVYPYPICNSLGCTMVSYRFLATAARFIEGEKKPVLLWLYN